MVAGWYRLPTSNGGQVMQIDGAPCRLMEVTLQSPSARGANLMVKARYRNLLTDQVLEKTFSRRRQGLRGGLRAPGKGQYLYASGDSGVFMDLESYEQFELGPELFDSVKGYLLDGTEVQLGMYQGRVVKRRPADGGGAHGDRLRPNDQGGDRPGPAEGGVARDGPSRSWSPPTSRRASASGRHPRRSLRLEGLTGSSPDPGVRGCELIPGPSPAVEMRVGQGGSPQP